MEVSETLKDGKLKAIRKRRDELLKLVDIEILIASDNKEDTTSLIEYRKALRDFTEPYKADRSLLNDLKVSDAVRALFALNPKHV